MDDLTPTKPALDKAFPILVGNRTQIAAFAILTVQVLGLVGLLPPDRVTEITEVLAPIALATLAAKVDRSSVAPKGPDVIVVGSPPAA